MSVLTILEKHQTYEISFVPTTNGTYSILSKHFLSNSQFHVFVKPQTPEVHDAFSKDHISTLFSNAIIVKQLTGEKVSEIDVGETVDIKLELKNNKNERLSAYRQQQINTECNLHEMSYYTVGGKRYQFQTFSSVEDSQIQADPHDSASLSVTIYQAGVAQFSVILKCPDLHYYFRIGCGAPGAAENNQCQLLIRPKDLFESVKIRVPLYPSDADRVQDPIDGSLMFFLNENLVIDLVLSDIYGNKIDDEVSLAQFYAAFEFGPSFGKKAFLTFEKSFHLGVISFTLSDDNNRIFKALPPRAGNAYYQISMTYTTYDNREIQKTIPVKLVSTDYAEPFNYIVPRWDSTEVSAELSSVQYDNMLKTDRPGRVYITLRNANFQQKEEWTSNLEQDLQIQVFQQVDGVTWTAADDLCSNQKSRGIYPGEYMAWFNCTTAQTYLAFSVMFQGLALLPDKNPFFVVGGDSYMVEFSESFTASLTNGGLLIYSQEFQPDVVGEQGLKLEFNVKDLFGNSVDTVLLARNTPDLGQMTYKIEKFHSDGTLDLVRKAPIIFMGMAKAFNCQLYINELAIGSYRLHLDIPSTEALSFSFKVSSRSTTLSMNQKYVQSLRFPHVELSKQALITYTAAHRVTYADGGEQGSSLPVVDQDGELMQANSRAAVIIDPRDLFNHPFTFTDERQKELAAQFLADVENLDTGDCVAMVHQAELSQTLSFQESAESDHISTRLLFLSEKALSTNGHYQIRVVYKDLDQGQLYVQGGNFIIQEEPASTEAEVVLYLAAGPQKSAVQNFRQVDLYQEGGYEQDTILTAQHYDARFDSILVLKAYLLDATKQPYKTVERSPAFSVTLYQITAREGKLQ